MPIKIVLIVPEKGWFRKPKCINLLTYIAHKTTKQSAIISHRHFVLHIGMTKMS